MSRMKPQIGHNTIGSIAGPDQHTVIIYNKQDPSHGM